MPSLFEQLECLSMPARARLLRLLDPEELNVGEIASIVQMPQSTVSRHLKALHDAGLITRRTEGPHRWFTRTHESPPDASALWEIVRKHADLHHAEDGLRLARVLALRAGEKSLSFGKLGSHWSELKREWFGEAYVLPAMLALLPPTDTIADLGCGPGDALGPLADAVHRVIGIDREPAMLEAAALRTAHLPNVELRRGELLNPPLAAGELDAALLMLVLHHIDDPGAVVLAAARALKAGGRLVIADLHAHTRHHHGYPHAGFTTEHVADWARRAGLHLHRSLLLPTDPAHPDPSLFVAVLLQH